jgi:hypothetical protein
MSERSIADRLTDVYTWIREPDWTEEASLEWVKDWINRRPVAEVGMIAMLMPSESAEPEPVRDAQSARMPDREAIEQCAQIAAAIAAKYDAAAVERFKKNGEWVARAASSAASEVEDEIRALIALAPADPAPGEPVGGDRCQIAGCCRKGVPGNENVIDGKIVCDYCHAAPAPHAGEAEIVERCAKVAEAYSHWIGSENHADTQTQRGIAIAIRALAPIPDDGKDGGQRS